MIVFISVGVVGEQNMKYVYFFIWLHVSYNFSVTVQMDRNIEIFTNVNLDWAYGSYRKIIQQTIFFMSITRTCAAHNNILKLFKDKINN